MAKISGSHDRRISVREFPRYIAPSTFPISAIEQSKPSCPGCQVVDGVRLRRSRKYPPYQRPKATTPSGPTAAAFARFLCTRFDLTSRLQPLCFLSLNLPVLFQTASYVLSTLSFFTIVKRPFRVSPSGPCFLRACHSRVQAQTTSSPSRPTHKNEK